MWSVFKAEMQALSGDPHITEIKFARVLAKAYHSQILAHIDTISGGGSVLTTDDKKTQFQSDILKLLSKNKKNPNREINLIEQIGPAVLDYWTGLGCLGPAGKSSITSTGTWVATALPKNLNFQILVKGLATAFQAHLLTLQGVHIVFTPPATVPWSGAFLTPA